MLINALKSDIYEHSLVYKGEKCFMELQKAFDLARSLMDQHGLQRWSLEWNDSQRTFGQCHSRGKITLSYDLVSLNSEEVVKDTILHEIAHALAGAHHAHNDVWRAKARQIGAKDRPCYSFSDVRSPLPWVGKCPGNHHHYKGRKPEGIRICTLCPNSIDRRISWEYKPSITKNNSLEAALVSAMAKLKK